MERTSLPPAGVTLTAAAGVVHVAAAAAHVDVSLLLAVAFLLLATVQIGVVATARRWPAVTAEALTFANLAAVGAWLVSRTVGLPLVGLGVEPVGVADVATVSLELAAVAAVVVGGRLAGTSSRLASLAVVASLGTVAIAAPATGHAHEDGHAHRGAEDHHGDTGPVEVAQPGAGAGDTDLSRARNADRMKALMTGAVEPIVITGGDHAHADDAVPHGH